MTSGRCVLALLLTCVAISACGRNGGTTGSSPSFDPAPPAQFVGRTTCEGCHEAAVAKWRGSHHDLAMEPADASTVLGNFDGATFTHFGVTSTFTKHDGKFFARTDGPEGKLHDYEIA